MSLGLRHRLVALALLAAPLAFAGCKQGLHERCQVLSDCDDGLTCVYPAGGTPQSGGVCEAPGTGANDMSVTNSPDLTPTADH